MTAAAVSPAPDAIRHIAAFAQGFSLEAIRPPVPSARASGAITRLALKSSEARAR